MKCVLGYVMLGMAAIGLLLGLRGEVLEVVRGEPAPLGTRLERILDRSTRGRSGLPGAALYIDSPGLGRWIGASGLADVVSEQPMSADHLFAIGSITKTYVAAVVLQLVEEGQIDLDASMDAYLPEEYASLFVESNRITPRMLLNHTSGIPEWLTHEVMDRLTMDLSYVWSVDELLRISADQEPYFEPGEGFFYSNTDYTLLGVIIEQVTGLPWEAQVQERILRPLGLDETVVRPPGDASTLPDMAKGYSDMGRELIDLTSADPSMAGAAGGNAMVASVSDLGLFLESLLAGDLFSNGSTLEEMLEWIDAPDDQGVHYWYGLGIERYEIDGVDFIGHGGGAVGYSTVMYRSPSQETTLVASTNIYGLGAAYLDLMIPALRELDR